MNVRNWSSAEGLVIILLVGRITIAWGCKGALIGLLSIVAPVCIVCG